MPEETDQKQHQCPYCKEIISDDYRGMYPFPEIPCPCCGSLVILSAAQNESESCEKRRDERFAVSLKVTYESFNMFMIDYTRNVSRGGMFVKTEVPHHPGEVIDVLLHVPEVEAPVKLLCMVVRNNFGYVGKEDTGIGVEFIDLDLTSRDLLIEALKKHKHKC